VMHGEGQPFLGPDQGLVSYELRRASAYGVTSTTGACRTYVVEAAGASLPAPEARRSTAERRSLDPA
jgi:hypothetical protein